MHRSSASRNRGGGVRPIAIADVWHRLASLCAMKGCAAEMELHPLQVPVGVPGGSGCIGHALHAGILADAECVTIQVDFRNAVKSLRRDAALAAVSERASNLLPFIQWTYRQHTRLFVRGAPQGSEPLLSQSGVRQGDPCGMLVFCLAFQTPLEQTQQLHPQTRVLAFADDCYLQGPPRHAAAAFHSLRDLAATIGLHMQLPKCSVYGHDTVAAEEVAQELGIGHAKAGMMACFTPLGTPAFITPFLAEHTERTCSLIDALLALPLATQNRFLVLRSSLQPRMDHLSHTVSRPLLHDHVSRLENALLDASYSLMHRPHAAGSPEDDQLALPLRHGRFVFRRMTAREAGAAQLSVAALTQATMRQGPGEFRPFDSSIRPRLQSLWEIVHDDAAGLWPEETRALTSPVIRDVLPSAKREYSHCAAAGAFQTLLDSFGAAGAAGLKLQAQLRCCASRPASIFLDTLPMATPLTISDAAFVSSMRHRLGLSQMPPGAPMVACDCAEQPTPPLPLPQTMPWSVTRAQRA
jgi:hypothetical protein